MITFAVFAVFAQTALPRLAVVEFSTNITSDRTRADVITVRNMVESKMIETRKYQIITRDEIDKLLQNQQIAVSNISSSENIKKLQLQNINYIVTGSVDAMGNDYAITVKVLDVSTGQFSNGADAFMGSGSRDLYDGVNALMGKFTAGMTASGDKVVQTEQNARAGSSGQVYKIGDFGPAGGIVFYDKGVFSAGWRYLEAAPAETEWTGVQWGAYQKDVSGTSLAVGSGKRNTQIIVDRLRQLNETGRAAQLCTSLDFDGYKDWFLPSKEELDLMYKNLKRKGVGGFTNSWYWSSSEDSNRTAALVQCFGDGIQGYGVKVSIGSVRAVRTFLPFTIKNQLP
jgi:hypothetical protein